MKAFLVLVAAMAMAAPALGTTFDRCSLAQQMYALGVPKSELPQWTCIAQHESGFRTDVVGPPNSNGSNDYGIFQINDLYWCQPPSGKFSYNSCATSCNNLLTDNIDEAVTCARMVKSQQGFPAWSTWHYCDGVLPSIDDCFGGSDNTAPEVPVVPDVPDVPDTGSDTGSDSGSNVIGNVIGSIKNTVGNVVGSVESDVGSIGNVVGSIQDQVGSAIGSVQNVVGSVEGQIGGAIGSVQNVVGSVQNVVGSIQNQVGDAVGSVQNVVGNAVGSVQNVVGSVQNAVGSVQGQIGNAVGSVEGQIGSIQQKISSLVHI